MRVLITDDSVFMRSAIGRTLEAEPDFEIVGKARNGLEAVEMAKALHPDVVTMDIEMPEMDGLTALRRIMRESPTQVLMCSTLTTEGSRQSLQALRLGAADVIPKVLGDTPELKQKFLEDLVRRLRGLGEANPHKPAESPHPATPNDDPPVLRGDSYDLLCIGSSTGGPPVLETILSSLPAQQSTPVVIAQHMPRLFTESMAKRLDEICPLTVVHAEDGMAIEAGHVYIAPGGLHTHIERASLAKRKLSINDQPKDAIYTPSVDALFGSAAKACGRRVVSVILTGIGEDGVKGAQLLNAAGAPILAQSKATCVVYGMPRAVAEAGFATAVLDPAQIAESLCTLTARMAA